MSCLHIGRVVDYCIVVANSQKLKYSSPKMTDSKLRRLTGLATHTDPNKRAVAAGHPNVPENVLEILVSDESVVVRQWVTRNPNVPKRLLERMVAEDGDVTVRAHAQYRLGGM